MYKFPRYNSEFCKALSGIACNGALNAVPNAPVYEAPVTTLDMSIPKNKIGVNQSTQLSLTQKTILVPIFSAHEKQKLADWAQQYPLSQFLSHPRTFEESSIEYAFVSSKIEGGRYSLKDTASLLKYGLTAGAKPFNDAVMIKNIHQAFIAICQTKKRSYPALSKTFVCGLHETVSHDLLPSQQCGKVREEPVHIAGSQYLPLSGATLLNAELDVLLNQAKQIDDPFECSIYTHLNLAYLQYFADGNKRTARLMQTAVLVNAGITPLIMGEEYIANYLNCIVHYYETGDSKPYAQLFLRSYHHMIEGFLGQTPEQLEAQRLAEEGIRARHALSTDREG